MTRSPWVVLLSLSLFLAHLAVALSSSSIPMQQSLPQEIPSAEGKLPKSSARRALRARGRRASPNWAQPPPLTSFYWQLSGYLSTKSSAKVFDADGFEMSSTTIQALKKAGKTVICYFSFGTLEDGRPDANKFPRSVIGGKVCDSQADNGKCLTYWPGERWLDVRSQIVRNILEQRLQLAAKKGCDGIEPDNLDAYANNINDPQGKPITKFTITKADQINFNRWIGTTAHKYHLSVGLKNSGELASAVVDVFDWALVEQCNEYTDWSTGEWYSGKYQCDYFNVFIMAGKAVFIAEYDDFWGDSGNWAGSGITFPKGLCSDNNAHGFSTTMHDHDLTPKYYPAADCLAHMPSSCPQACYKKCLSPQALGPYKNPEMTKADKFGECARTCAAKGCPYV